MRCRRGGCKGAVKACLSSFACPIAQVCKANKGPTLPTASPCRPFRRRRCGLRASPAPGGWRAGGTRHNITLGAKTKKSTGGRVALWCPHRRGRTRAPANAEERLCRAWPTGRNPQPRVTHARAQPYVSPPPCSSAALRPSHPVPTLTGLLTYYLFDLQLLFPSTAPQHKTAFEDLLTAARQNPWPESSPPRNAPWCAP